MRAWLIVVAALALSAARADSHHAFSPVYDEKRIITIEGVVTEFKYVNPHALMFMDVTDETGKAVTWTVEFAGRLNLDEAGWTPESIKAGERAKVTGNPTHTGSRRMFFRELVRPDGSKLLPGNAQRLNAIEEERRRRARQRKQQE